VPNNIILPTNDLAFKKLFANNAHKDIPIGFIQDFYEIPMADITIENPYSIEEFNTVLEKSGKPDKYGKFQ